MREEDAMSRVECSLVVQAPADTVYQVWRNVENFPNFMSDIDEVSESPRGVTHWRQKRAIGEDIEWDAEITQDEPALALAWRVAGKDQDGKQRINEASVSLEPMGDATRVRYAVEYDERSGIGSITSFFASDESRIEHDLRRFKDIVESGGYMRATERIANVNTTEAEEQTVKERYPANAYRPADEEHA
jgi:uncharacterized membrane protein